MDFDAPSNTSAGPIEAVGPSTEPSGGPSISAVKAEVKARESCS